MCRHFLRVFEGATVGEIGRDAGCPKTVIADRRVDAGCYRAPSDHAPGIGLRHGLFKQHGRVVPGCGAEEIAFAIFGNASGINVGTQFLGECMMARHLVVLTAFFVQPDLPAGALRPEVLDLHLERRIYARERIGEGGDQCPVAPIAQRIGRNGVNQLAPFLRVQHGRLAGFHNMLRATHSRRRVYRHNLASDQPVEQHPHGRQLLFNIRRRMGQLARLDIGGDVMRPDCRKRQAAFVAPGEESCACPGIGAASVVVVDIGGEEFDVAPSGGVAKIGDERRHYIGVGRCRERAGRDDGGKLVGPTACSPRSNASCV